MPSCACLQSSPAVTREWILLAMLAVLTLFNLSYWYAQRDGWKRVSPPKVHRIPKLNVFDHRQEKTTAASSRPSDVPLELLFWRPVESLLSGYGRLPFPVEKVSFLPVAYSVVHRCHTGGPLNHIFFVHSAPNNWVKRRLLRETIGDVAMATKHSWTTVFFVGLSRNLGVQQKVLDEAERHGDIVMLPYVDEYRNLTYKYVYGIKWTMDNCPRVPYVVKMDDDIVINLTKLVAYLKQRKRTEPPAFHCYVWTNMQVERSTDSPWYLSKKMYRKRFFSRYCSGSVVLFANRVMEAVYNASFAVPFLPVDDAYVTGEAAKKAGVGHVKLNRYYSLFEDSWREVATGKYVFAQVYHPKDRRKSWNIIMRELREPTLAFLDYGSSFHGGATGLDRSDEFLPAGDEGESAQSSATNVKYEKDASPPPPAASYEDTRVVTRDTASHSSEARSRSKPTQVAARPNDSEARVRDKEKDAVRRDDSKAEDNVASRSGGESPRRGDDGSSAAFILRGQG
ncbi:hypothetical protein MRX96_009531 [Rhipicephalus microplus]